MIIETGKIQIQKNMQTLLVNRFEYVRSTFIPKIGYTSSADLSVRVT